MKKITTILGLFTGSILFGQQNATNNNPSVPAQNGTNDRAFWSRSGNTLNNGSNNIFGTLWNSPIYTKTDNIQRQILMGTSPAGSITGAFGLGTISPQSFMHLSNFDNSLTSSGSGKLFRTDGLASFNNEWSMFTGLNASLSTQKFRIMVPANGNNVFLQAVNDAGRLDFRTGSATVTASNSRLMIERAVLPSYQGVNTAGFVAIYAHLNTLDRRPPAAPLHIFGQETANAQGWNRGIQLSDRAIIQWGGDRIGGGLSINPTPIPKGFFMGHPSELPNGNMYAGIVDSLHAASPVNYVYAIQVNAPIGSTTNPNPEGTMNLYKNVLIHEINSPVITLANERHLGVNTLNPNNIVEINTANVNAIPGKSGLRLTDLTAVSTLMPNPGAGVLTVDSLGDVIYVQGGSGAFGTFCADSVNGKLQYDTKVDLNNHNLYFTNNDSIGGNKIGVGYDCGTALEAKFNVYSSDEIWAGSYYTNGNSPINPNFQGGLKSVIDSTSTLNARAIYGYVEPNLTSNMVSQIGVMGQVKGRDVKEAVGVYGASTVTIPNSGAIGGRFITLGSAVGRAVQAQNITSQGSATPYSGFGFGGDFSATNFPGTTVNNNTGVKGSGNGTAAINIGIQGYAVGGTINRAGLFQGSIEAAAALVVSDQQFKTNVTPIGSALKLVNQLRPTTYFMDTTNFSEFNFGSEKQYGFIAQQVGAIIPELMHNSMNPATYDSLGNELISSTSYKSLNYNAIIPINTQAIIELDQKVNKLTLSDESIKTNVTNLTGSLDKVLDMRGVTYDWNQTVHTELNLDSVTHIGFIAQEINAIDPLLTFVDADTLMHVEYDKIVPILAEAMQELNAKIENRDSIIDALNARLTNLENCLSALLPSLCQMNHSMIQNNTQQTQEQVRSQLAVTLSNKTSIILDQNVPNPFAEQTTINFSIPVTVVKAQIHFYNAEGKLMQSVDVTERGLGSLTVFGSDLSSGVYTYTLVADGQIVATKRMVKQ